MRNKAWARFFDGHAAEYMKNAFTKHTKTEVRFVLEELKLPRGSRILDVGCGTGRHAVELDRKGYRVTGLDVSAGMLRKAKEAAEEAGVQVEWVQADATRFRTRVQYDAAICLCEGAFGLLELDEHPVEHDERIMQNIYAALKPRGRFILTAPNGLAKIRHYSQRDVQEGKFDPLTLVETYVMRWKTPKGMRSVLVRERGYLPQDLILLFHKTGFKVEDICGGTAGSWKRRPIDLDEVEIMSSEEK